MLDCHYCCPVCGLLLEKQEKRLFCQNNHSFDLAKSGYVNLLLAQQKNAKDPGDNKAMVVSRGNFLDQGYYAHFSEQLSEFVGNALAGKEYLHILDVGCGEGYFTANIKRKLTALGQQHITFWGVDISKPAIHAATKRDKEIHFSVASNHHLPFLAGVMDCLLWTFAPGEVAEFWRVLKPGGKMVTVVPGKRHLWGLKELLYEQPREHEVKQQTPAGFHLLTEKIVEDRIHLSSVTDVQNLLLMTPYYWHITEEARARAEQTAELWTDLAFVLRLYEKDDQWIDTVENGGCGLDNTGIIDD